MKRCPQCHFIYEEEQAFCDMDGARLVHDTHALPPTGPVPQKVSRPAWKQRLLIFVPIIAILMFAVVALRSNTNTPSAEPIAAAAGSTSPLTGSETVKVEDEAAPKDAQPVETSTSRSESSNTRRAANRDSDRVTSPSRSAQNSTPKTASRTQVNPPPARREQKDESRIGSIFSKTKRLIKKPFKF